MNGEIQAQWEALKKQKSSLTPEEYTNKVESLLDWVSYMDSTRPESFLFYDEMCALLDLLQIAITVTDRNAKIMYSNTYFASLYKTDKESLTSQSLADLYPSLRSMNSERNDQLVLKSGLPRLGIQEQVTTPNGERTFNTNKYPFKHEGKILGVLTISVDMTDHTNSIKELERAKQMAEDANNAKGQFLANISHEIRTPLNIIIGNSEILKESIPQRSIEYTYLKGIIISGTNLLNLINDILDLSKVDSGKMIIKKEPINVRNFLNEIKEIFKVKAQEKGLNFEFEVEESLPSILWIDEIRLRQVLFNLIGNAVKFTIAGSIRLEIRSKLKSKQVLDLFIDVKDTGIGIPPSQQRIIFEPFRQQVGQSTRTFGGTGLGLAISKRLVEAMDGRISVSSNIDMGSAFRVYLSSVEYENEWTEADPADSIEYRFEPANILIAEDVDEHLEIMKSYLKSDALTLYDARNGQEVLSKLSQIKPDLIIMDIQMPVMNGFKAAKTIRESSQFNTIPIIAVSAFSDISKQNKVLEVCSDFIQKPLSKAVFLERVAKYLPAQKITKQAEAKTDSTEKDDLRLFDEQLAELDKNDLYKDFKLEFSSKIIDLYDEIQLNMSMNNFGLIGFQSLDIGMRYKIGILTETGKQIEEYLSSFRLEEIIKLMPLFDKMIKKVKSNQKSGYGTTTN